MSFTDAKSGEDVRQYIIWRPTTGNLLERRTSLLQVREHELF
jgi:hypothetical protein